VGVFYFILVFIDMNKQLRKYFDYKFENGEIDSKPYDENGNDWFGIWNDDFLIVGHPSDDDNNIWFSNGPYFQSGLDMFDIEPHYFYIEMRKYMEQKYPELEIREIY